MASKSEAAIRLVEVNKRFSDVDAVHDVSLDVMEGEFFSLLGPSGCGKTTTLRMLAGLETPDTGSIYLHETDVTYLPANKRTVNLVFQNYELFPHMTVFENVSYGLRIKKVAKGEIRQRVADMLEIVGVAGLESRKANQLSGGQQQRVALARALVNRPAVLLLDEPLSALDVKLRKRMQIELKSIQNKLGTTFIYVTHDQEEALFLSDRIGIMSQGVLLQVGSPREIYERPTSAFVADFVGSLNTFEFVPESTVDSIATAAPSAKEKLSVLVDEADARHTLRVAIRPERMRILPITRWQESEPDNRVRGRVEDIAYLGPTTQIIVRTDTFGSVVGQSLSNQNPASALHEGDEVVVSWPMDAAFILRGWEPHQ